MVEMGLDRLRHPEDEGLPMLVQQRQFLGKRLAGDPEGQPPLLMGQAVGGVRCRSSSQCR